jgi:hypothetical protein
MWKDDATALIRSAVRAPSSHNTQPWLFEVTDAGINLFADRTRALPVTDPDDRELTISCGCALMNLRVAAAEARIPLTIDVLPDASQPDWLARVSRAAAADAAVSTDDAHLFAFLERRHTYRKRFAPDPVPTAVIADLTNAAEREGASLRPAFSGYERTQVAALVAEGDATQWADPTWRRELAAWMHPRRRGDGLVVPGAAAPLAHAVIRTFDMGDGIGAKDRDLVEASPLLAVLDTNGNRTTDWLVAGQALERVLLVACSHHLQASFLNQPIQVPALRPLLRHVVGAEAPQVLLRLGYPLEPLAPTPRRSLDEVLLTPEPAR